MRWIELINARGISTKTALELGCVVADIRQRVPMDKEAFVRVEIFRGRSSRTTGPSASAGKWFMRRREGLVSAWK